MPRLLAIVLAVATAMTACSMATPPSSPEPPASPSSLATVIDGSSPASPTIGASPALAVVRASTLPARLPTGLSRAVAILAGDRIDIYGGFTSAGSTTGEILEFDPATDHVGAVGELALRVHDAAGVTLGGAATIFGGGSAAPTSVVQQVDADGVARVIGNLPTARADLSAVAVGTSAIIIGGGAAGVAAPRILATDDGVHFRVVATLVVPVRYAAVAEVGGRIYVIGGVGAAGETSDIQRIDLTTGKVEVIGRMPNAISHAAAMVIGGRLFVVGGRRAGTAQDAIWQVDAGSGTTQLVARLPQPVSDFALTVVGGVGYAIGGETDTQITSIVAIVVS